MPKQFILIRGLLRESRHWGTFPDQLQQQFPAAAILTPDIPGNGRHYQFTSPATIAGITDRLQQEQEIRTWPDSFILIGISMGGMVAMDWLSRYPQHIAGVVLINTSVRSFSPFYHRLRWQSYAHILKMIFCSPQQREAGILQLTSNRFQHDTELLQQWRQWQNQFPVSADSARNQLLAAIRFHLPDKKPQQPVLIVASKADRLVDYRCSLKLADYWQTSLSLHKTAGHDLPLDDPCWLAGIIQEWVDRHLP